MFPGLLPGFRDKARVDGVVFRSTSETVGGKLLFRVHSVSGEQPHSQARHKSLGMRLSWIEEC